MVTSYTGKAYSARRVAPFATIPLPGQLRYAWFKALGEGCGAMRAQHQVWLAPNDQNRPFGVFVAVWAMCACARDEPVEVEPNRSKRLLTLNPIFDQGLAENDIRQGQKSMA